MMKIQQNEHLSVWTESGSSYILANMLAHFIISSVN